MQYKKNFPSIYMNIYLLRNPHICFIVSKGESSYNVFVTCCEK